MPILPGAEPYHHAGGPVGALMCHGFTGSPQSMRPWAEHLAAAGLTVALPRLPGHGTRWQDANMTTWDDWYACIEREFLALRERCEAVFVCGLSMGGTLSLRLAEQHGRDLAGVVVVNPSVIGLDPRLKVLPVLQRVLPSLGGIGSDIKKPGVDELAYSRVPLRALYSLRRAWDVVRADLPKVTQPLLLLRSAEDHVVEPESSRLVLARVSSTDVTEIVLEDSYHVATLDNDADRIFGESLDFIRRIRPTVTSG
ncbi:alpha/beta fold hydrolase [Sporichthya brevicatena]|uniref:Alpha/beta fold hydrolase n=1 Tax=Sporichthya brevicatena TaxID=171442 RepID=A0ABN1GSZ9_9ACTN